jgi:hypothetical protein
LVGSAGVARAPRVGFPTGSLAGLLLFTSSVAAIALSELLKDWLCFPGTFDQQVGLRELTSVRSNDDGPQAKAVNVRRHRPNTGNAHDIARGLYRDRKALGSADTARRIYNLNGSCELSRWNAPRIEDYDVWETDARWNI